MSMPAHVATGTVAVSLIVPCEFPVPATIGVNLDALGDVLHRFLSYPQCLAFPYSTVAIGVDERMFSYRSLCAYMETLHHEYGVLQAFLGTQRTTHNREVAGSNPASATIKH